MFPRPWKRSGPTTITTGQKRPGLQSSLLPKHAKGDNAKRRVKKRINVENNIIAEEGYKGECLPERKDEWRTMETHLAWVERGTFQFRLREGKVKGNCEHAVITSVV